MNQLQANEHLSNDRSTKPLISIFDISQSLAWLVALILVLSAFSVPTADAASRLKVSPNKRFLINEDGTPFFYLADTAWYLIPRLTREEIDYYLDNRKAKGFTVIQVDAFRASDLRNSGRTNRYGQRPLLNNDVSQLNEPYFQHVDYVIRQAEAKGLYVALLPIWGDMVTQDYFNGVVNSFLDADKAEAYGKYIGTRYRKDSKIIWVLGGDRSPTSAESRMVWRALAKGIAVGVSGSEDYDKVLMTFHPAGPDRGAKYFHQDAWRDFNMFQTGHFNFDIANDDFASEDYALTPPKPTLDGESRYEDYPVGNKIENGRFDSFDMRQAAYWSLLAGACGHTYGDHNVWQMYTPDRSSIAGARLHWRQTLDHPGAVQMGLVRKLFGSRPFQKLVPDQSIINGNNGKGTAHIRAARAEDGSFLFVYAPVGQQITINLEKIAGGRCQAWWYNPRDGQVEKIGQFATAGTKEFVPPKMGRGQDWVIVIDSVAQAFPQPGG